MLNCLLPNCPGQEFTWIMLLQYNIYRDKDLFLGIALPCFFAFVFVALIIALLVNAMSAGPSLCNQQILSSTYYLLLFVSQKRTPAHYSSQSQ